MVDNVLVIYNCYTQIGGMYMAPLQNDARAIKKFAKELAQETHLK